MLENNGHKADTGRTQPMPHLTDRLIRQIEPPTGATQIRLVDDEITGFGIRVTKKGARTFS